MAVRPVFVVHEKKPFYSVWNCEFTYNAGFSTQQKQKNITAIHSNFENRFKNNHILEISSKSMQDLGVKLSAFNLTKYVPELGKSVPVECVYQAGKVFEGNIQYKDLIETTPRNAKKDERISSSGRIVAFSFDGKEYPSEPKNAFYDYIYINALLEHEELLSELLEYDAFTDIEFNPEKSINCQARAAAVLVSLARSGNLDKAKNFYELASFFGSVIPCEVQLKQEEPSDIKLILGDITKCATDAIVNASDKVLSGGGGIDKVIHNAAGSALKDELYEKRIDTGEAIVTKGYNLPAKFIIHTAGPRYKDGLNGEAQLLKKTYTSCLEAAKENGIKSFAFCSISTGAFNFPLNEAADIAIKTILDWLKKEGNKIDVLFSFIDEKTLIAYKNALNKYNQDSEKPDKEDTKIPVFNVGQKVKHLMFGEGEIIKVDETTVTIKFNIGEKTLSSIWVSEKCKII